MSNDKQASAMAILTGLGFTPEIGGGGSVFMSIYRADGSHIWITETQGCDMPTESDWMIGVYPPDWDGEQINYLYCEDSPLSLFDAARAAMES